MAAASSVLNQQGSFTALSLLAANPQAQLLATAVIGGVAVTVAGATFIYKKFKQYEEKKHLEEINAVNKLHKDHLATIPVPGKNEILTLPRIFQEGEQNTFESLHYNEDIVHTMANKFPGQTDIALSLYQEAIRDAILKLKEYYFSRSDNNDTTGSVLAYLLEMIDSHCLKFEGYDYDIAYLKAIAAFINAYASKGDNHKTKRFTHLDEVYSNIVKAQHLLDLHKDVLSLQELLSDLYDSCRNLNDEALRTFAMMITPIKQWGLMDTVTKKELSHGMLKKYFIEGGILGLINFPDKEVSVLDSPFKDSLIELVKYALKSIDPEKTLGLNDIPKIAVPLPNLARYIELRDKQDLTPEEKEEKKGIRKQLEDFKALFYECRNFVTLELDPKTANSKHNYMPVTDYAEVVNRVSLVINFANLIRKIISLQYYSINLIKGIKSLGEIDVSNKYHKKIFTVLDELSVQIQNDYLKLKTDLYKIQENSNNAMHIEKITKHRERLYSLLETTNTTISVTKEKIKKYWHKNREQTAKRKFDAEYNLFASANLVAKTHDLPCSKEAGQKRKSSSKQNEKPKKIISTAERASQASLTQNMKDILAQPQGQALVENAKEPALENKIQHNFTRISRQITLIRKEEKPAAGDSEGKSLFEKELDAYIDLSRKLNLVSQKIVIMNNETNLTEERKEKIQHLVKILAEMSDQVKQFLQLKRNERIRQAPELCATIQRLLTLENQLSFIDEHRDSFWRFANSVFGAGFFRTDSRIKLSNVSLACNQLMQILTQETNSTKLEHGVSL